MGPGRSRRLTLRAADALAMSDAGPHQPGIVIPPQRFLRLAAFDLLSDRAGDLEAVLEAWSTWEHRAGLTVTIGLGRTLFERGGDDRLGLRARMPTGLRPLPAFQGDALDPGRSGGDLCLQVCADDPEAVRAAVERLTEAATGLAGPRWAQAGFRFPPDPAQGAASQRDLLGFRDGTANIRSHHDLDEHVWAGAGDRTWMRGGTYLVARRIRLDLAAWRALGVQRQESTIGRHKDSGAPLGERREYDPRRLGPGGPIPADAHVSVAAPEHNQGVRLLRRSYNYDDGPADAGLLFVAFARDPARQYVPVQRRLAAGDALSRFATHTASALFAIPPRGAKIG